MSSECKKWMILFVNQILAHLSGLNEAQIQCVINNLNKSQKVKQPKLSTTMLKELK